ncbi:hypothetical protein VNO78_15214 [Psophocarpus tetragonolobus]|uniref:Uncharacterized protein n=1 Tax=Psophocarpus tetragonolobus TaxID=3891 RepID=A0AAN9XJK5_PSOTE
MNIRKDFGLISRMIGFQVQTKSVMGYGLKVKSFAGTSEPPGGPDPTAPHFPRAAPSSRRRLELPRSRRILGFGAAPRSLAALRRVSTVPDPVRSWASALLRAFLQYSAAVSNRPDRDLDRISAAQLAADLGFSALFYRAARSSSSSSRFLPPRSRFGAVPPGRARSSGTPPCFDLPDPVGTTAPDRKEVCLKGFTSLRKPSDVEAKIVMGDGAGIPKQTHKPASLSLVLLLINDKLKRLVVSLSFIDSHLRLSY